MATNNDMTEIIKESLGVTEISSTYNEDRHPFRLKVNHGGKFTDSPLFYVNAKNSVFFIVKNLEKFTYETLREFIMSLGYSTMGFCYFHLPEENLEIGLMKLMDEDDVKIFKGIIVEKGYINLPDIYVEHGQQSVFLFYPQSLKKAPIERISKLICDLLIQKPLATIDDAIEYVKMRYGIVINNFKMQSAIVRARLVLQVDNRNDDQENEDVENHDHDDEDEFNGEESDGDDEYIGDVDEDGNEIPELEDDYFDDDEDYEKDEEEVEDEEDGDDSEEDNDDENDDENDESVDSDAGNEDDEEDEDDELDDDDEDDDDDDDDDDDGNDDDDDDDDDDGNDDDEEQGSEVDEDEEEDEFDVDEIDIDDYDG